MYYKIVKYYDSWIDSLNSPYVYFLLCILPSMLKELSNGGEKILDVGCGTGRFLKNSSDIFSHCYGIDISKTMIQFANNDKRYRNCKFVQKDILQFNPNEKYDIITCLLDTVNHFKKQQQLDVLFEKASLCLGDCGVFLFDIFTSNGFNIIWNQEGTTRISDVILKWKSYYSPEIKSGKLTIEAFSPESNIPLWLETINEYYYPLPFIHKCLLKHGFQRWRIIDIFDGSYKIVYKHFIIAWKTKVTIV